MYSSISSQVLRLKASKVKSEWLDLQLFINYFRDIQLYSNTFRQDWAGDFPNVRIKHAFNKAMARLSKVDITVFDSSIYGRI